MKNKKILFFIFSFSCINIITNSTQYNSLYFTGGSWMETSIIDSMKIDIQKTNDFTIQFWVSGSIIDTNEAPALFSLVDSEDSIKLAVYRDRGNNKAITTIINSIVKQTEIENLDWSLSDSFHLISFVFSINQGLKGFFNDQLFINSNEKININDTKLIFGAVANKSYTILKNFWYGYIDEIRLWNTILADSIIQFHYLQPNKLGDYYKQTYLDSLIGLWRFNLFEPTNNITDESNNDNFGILYSLPNYSIELSLKGVK